MLTKFINSERFKNLQDDPEQFMLCKNSQQRARLLTPLKASAVSGVKDDHHHYRDELTIELKP